MAIVPNFVASQAIGLPSIITLTDTSTGSDSAIVSRRVFLLTSTGDYLVPSGTATDYITWAYASSSTQLNVLQQDMGLSINVQWLDIADAVLYTKTIAYSFTLYSESFLYSLTQAQVADNAITQDNNYYMSKMILRVEIDSANQAISYASDLVSCQSCLNRAALMIQNESYYF